MTIQARRLPTEHLVDPRIRSVIIQIEAWLRDISRILNDSITTDPTQGLVRTRGPVVPDELRFDPTQVSTFGRVGEVQRLGGLLFVKQQTTGNDKNWAPLVRSGDVIEEVVFGTAAPTADATSPPFFVDTSTEPDMLFVRVFKAGVWVYDASPFTYYSPFSPIASDVSPGYWVDTSANPSVWHFKLQDSGGLWNYETIDFTAGAGMTGGGTAGVVPVAFNVVANADGSIVVNADDIQVGVLATDAQHGVRGGGTQHAVAVPAGAAGFMTGADKTILDGLSAAVGTRLTFVIQASKPTASATSAHVWIQDSGTGTQKWWVRLRKSSGPDVYDYYKTKEP